MALRYIEPKLSNSLNAYPVYNHLQTNYYNLRFGNYLEGLTFLTPSVVLVFRARDYTQVGLFMHNKRPRDGESWELWTPVYFLRTPSRKPAEVTEKGGGGGLILHYASLSGP